MPDAVVDGVIDVEVAAVPLAGYVTELLSTVKVARGEPLVVDE